ncbi:hypothetical protein [Leucobacter luti]|uniref:hypothetical protein n=1 Tax=Leucobacter luti TaxID=340320 RepID=UPI0037C09A69
MAPVTERAVSARVSKASLPHQSTIGTQPFAPRTLATIQVAPSPVVGYPRRITS